MAGRFEDRASKPHRGPGDILRWKLGKKEARSADWDAQLDRALPTVRDGGATALASGAPVACWIGHATWVWRLGGKVIATDPVFGTSLRGVIRRQMPVGVALDEVPPLDIVTISHDHMDHMDMATLKRIGPAPLYVVPLGNKVRLERLGFPRVVELDWWESHDADGVEITLVPSRHWAMRAPWTRNDTLWGGFVFRAAEGVAYHAGDTAGGDHFAEIGARVGAIDWAMLPIGAYSPRWFMEPQHCDPDDAGAGFLALGAHHLLAMHWGTFRLTDEPLGEPPARMRAWWAERNLAADRLWILDPGEARVISPSLG